MHPTLPAILAIAALMLGGSTPTTAAEAGGDHAKHDGKHHQELLEKFDANHDGKLDKSERQAAKAALEERIKEHHPKLFEKFDANHDGKLDREELKALREARRERHREHQGK
jgi:hypothetical protein